MIRTYIDSSVLIAAASQRDRGGIEALSTSRIRSVSSSPVCSSRSRCIRRHEETGTETSFAFTMGSLKKYPSRLTTRTSVLLLFALL